MSHAHHHDPFDSAARLGWVAALNVVITLAQAAGGLWADSLALLSDALHNASDVLALLLAWWAARLRHRPASEKYTFGLRRAEILAALFNAAALIGIALLLAGEAVQRLAEPPAVPGGLVAGLAALALVVNGASVWVLREGHAHHGHAHHGEDLNRRAAVLHLLGDALTSLAVLGGGLAMWRWRAYWIDPALTVAISAWLLWASWGIVRRAVDVLLMASPPGLSLHAIEAAMRAEPAVQDVHHLHLWQLDGERIHLEAHVRVADLPMREVDALRRRLVARLAEQFGIGHVTLQFESGACEAPGRPMGGA